MIHHQQIIRQFEEALALWQKERPRRDKFVRWGTETVLEWHKYEMESLLVEVNSHRAVLGFGSITMPALLDTERMAVGHIDYTHKLALYAAELAQGVKNPPA